MSRSSGRPIPCSWWPPKVINMAHLRDLEPALWNELQPMFDAFRRHQSHPTVRLSLKDGETDVDEGVASVVGWLDGFASIHTFSSCQRDERDGAPYVAFFCFDPADLRMILEAGAGRYFDCKVYAHFAARLANGIFNYVLRFCNANMFGTFVRKYVNRVE